MTLLNDVRAGNVLESEVTAAHPERLAEVKERRRKMKLFHPRIHLTHTQKQAHRHMAKDGILAKLTKVREAINAPQGLTDQTQVKSQHPKHYIEAVLGWAAMSEEKTYSTNDKPTKDGNELAKIDPRVFAKAFLDRSPILTNTDTGLCAMQFEAWLATNSNGLFKKLVETIADGQAKSFIVVFDAKITKEELEALEEKQNIVRFEMLVNVGDYDKQHGIVSDVAIMECFPVSKSKKVDNVSKNTTPTTAQQNGGATDNTFTMPAQESRQYCEAAANGLPVQSFNTLFPKHEQIESNLYEANGIIFKKVNNRMYPSLFTLHTSIFEYNHPSKSQQQYYRGTDAVWSQEDRWAFYQTPLYLIGQAKGESYVLPGNIEKAEEAVQALQDVGMDFEQQVENFILTQGQKFGYKLPTLKARVSEQGYQRTSLTEAITGPGIDYTQVHRDEMGRVIGESLSKQHPQNLLNEGQGGKSAVGTMKERSVVETTAIAPNKAAGFYFKVKENSDFTGDGDEGFDDATTRTIFNKAADLLVKQIRLNKQADDDAEAVDSVSTFLNGDLGEQFADGLTLSCDASDANDVLLALPDYVKMKWVRGAFQDVIDQKEGIVATVCGVNEDKTPMPALRMNMKDFIKRMKHVFKGKDVTEAGFALSFMFPPENFIPEDSPGLVSIVGEASLTKDYVSSVHNPNRLRTIHSFLHKQIHNENNGDLLKTHYIRLKRHVAQHAASKGLSLEHSPGIVVTKAKVPTTKKKGAKDEGSTPPLARHHNRLFEAAALAGNEFDALYHKKAAEAAGWVYEANDQLKTPPSTKGHKSDYDFTLDDVQEYYDIHLCQGNDSQTAAKACETKFDIPKVEWNALNIIAVDGLEPTGVADTATAEEDLDATAPAGGVAGGPTPPQDGDSPDGQDDADSGTANASKQSGKAPSGFNYNVPNHPGMDDEDSTTSEGLEEAKLEQLKRGGWRTVKVVKLPTDQHTVYVMKASEASLGDTFLAFDSTTDAVLFDSTTADDASLSAFMKRVSTLKCAADAKKQSPGEDPSHIFKRLASVRKLAPAGVKEDAGPELKEAKEAGVLYAELMDYYGELLARDEEESLKEGSAEYQKWVDECNKLIATPNKTPAQQARYSELNKKIRDYAKQNFNKGKASKGWGEATMSTSVSGFRGNGYARPKPGEGVTFNGPALRKGLNKNKPKGMKESEWLDYVLTECQQDAPLNEFKIGDDDMTKWLVARKSIMIDNIWWTITSRDKDKGTFELATSSWAIKDGHKMEKKSVTWTQMAANLNSGKWGCRIPDKGYIGAKQDKDARAKVRAKNGIRKAPGTAKESIDTFNWIDWLSEVEYQNTTIPGKHNFKKEPQKKDTYYKFIIWIDTGDKKLNDPMKGIHKGVRAVHLNATDKEAAIADIKATYGADVKITHTSQGRVVEGVKKGVDHAAWKPKTEAKKPFGQVSGVPREVKTLSDFASKKAKEAEAALRKKFPKAPKTEDAEKLTSIGGFKIGDTVTLKRNSANTRAFMGKPAMITGISNQHKLQLNWTWPEDGHFDGLAPSAVADPSELIFFKGTPPKARKSGWVVAEGFPEDEFEKLFEAWLLSGATTVEGVDHAEWKPMTENVDNVSTLYVAEGEPITAAQLCERVSDAPYSGEGPYSSKDKDEPLAKMLTTWVKRGNIYAPSGPLKTMETIDNRAYEIEMTMQGVQFRRVKPQTDELYTFPSSVMDETVKEVDHFWACQENYEKLGLMHCRGILMYGPPGSGKSSALQQVVEMMTSRGDVVLFAKSVSAIREGLRAFKEIEPKRRVVVVFEEVEAMIGYSENERTLLGLMDGDEKINNVLYLATTNYIDRLPERLLRPGRFDSKVYVGQPSYEGRLAYFKNKLSKAGLAEDDTIEKLAKDTDGMSFGHMRELLVGAFALKQPMDKTLERLKEKTKDRVAKLYAESVMPTHELHAALTTKQIQGGRLVALPEDVKKFLGGLKEGTMTPEQQTIHQQFGNMTRIVRFPDYFVQNGMGKLQFFVNMIDGPNTLIIKWKRGDNQAIVNITYNKGPDTYSVKTQWLLAKKNGKYKVFIVRDMNGIHADQLRDPSLMFPRKDIDKIRKDFAKWSGDDDTPTDGSGPGNGSGSGSAKEKLPGTKPTAASKSALANEEQGNDLGGHTTEKDEADAARITKASLRAKLDTLSTLAEKKAHLESCSDDYENYEKEWRRNAFRELVQEVNESVDNVSTGVNHDTWRFRGFYNEPIEDGFMGIPKGMTMNGHVTTKTGEPTVPGYVECNGLKYEIHKKVAPDKNHAETFYVKRGAKYYSLAPRNPKSDQWILSGQSGSGTKVFKLDFLKDDAKFTVETTESLDEWTAMTEAERMNFEQYCRKHGVNSTPLDHSMLSPNGKVSKSSRDAANKRLDAGFSKLGKAQSDYQDAVNRGEIIDPTGKYSPEAPKEDLRVKDVLYMRQRATELLRMANLGMSKRSFTKEAAKINAEADALEKAMKGEAGATTERTELFQ